MNKMQHNIFPQWFGITLQLVFRLLHGNANRIQKHFENRVATQKRGRYEIYHRNHSARKA